jgi:adenine-specific DNA-methyltransferase
MRYIGSKASTAQWLTNFVAKHAPNATSLSDPFAGTCTVSRAFKRVGYKVVTGDLLKLSHTIQMATVGLNRPPAFAGIIDRLASKRDGVDCADVVLGHLNALRGRRRYFSKHFSASSGRLFFTDANAAKLDAVREEIAEWSADGTINEAEEAYLLTALVFAADKVANTAGTYYAYLKTLSRKAVKTLKLVPPLLADNRKRNLCFLADAREVVARQSADVLYLDPPYNERDYSGYYHLPDSIIRNDRPEPGGRSGAPTLRRSEKSDFCRPARAEAAFERLVGEAKARYILVHYTTTGLIGNGDRSRTETCRSARTRRRRKRPARP